MCTKTTLETVLDLFVKKVKELFGDKLKEVILFGSYAREVIEEAEALFKIKNFKGANNRVYYAVFQVFVFVAIRYK